MGLNRMMFVKRPAGSSGGDEPANMFVMTMGQQGGQYGYSRYNATIGEVTGGMQHDGREVTLVMLSYYSGYLDFAFNVEDVTGGKYNVTVKVTSVESNTGVTIEFPNIQYQSYVPAFYEYTNTLPSGFADMFTAKNVGKKFRVEIIFN